MHRQEPARALDADDLDEQRAAPDGAKVGVLEHALEDVGLAAELAAVDLVEERHHHEDVEEDGEHFSHRVAITPFWRFPDDVVVLFVPQGDDTAIALYSASRLGQSDLGVNPDRLESLHAALVAVQATS